VPIRRSERQVLQLGAICITCKVVTRQRPRHNVHLLTKTNKPGSGQEQEPFEAPKASNVAASTSIHSADGWSLLLTLQDGHQWTLALGPVRRP